MAHPTSCKCEGTGKMVVGEGQQTDLLPCDAGPTSQPAPPPSRDTVRVSGYVVRFMLPGETAPRFYVRTIAEPRHMPLDPMTADLYEHEETAEIIADIYVRDTFVGLAVVVPLADPMRGLGDGKSDRDSLGLRTCEYGLGDALRDKLGRAVRDVWVAYARTQPNPKPHHLLSFDELDEQNKEVDRLIGERLWLMGYRAAIKKGV